MAASILTAILMDLDFDNATDRIERLRNCQFDKAERSMGGPWVDSIVTERFNLFPTASCYVTSALRQGCLVHGGHRVHDGVQPLCKWHKGGKAATYKGAYVEVATAADAASQLGDRFCTECFPMLPASLQLQVVDAYALRPASQAADTTS